MQEIVKVLAYPKFDLAEEEIKSVINDDILPYVEIIKITRQVEGICADPGDDIFLACAINGKADAIISGDSHLLALQEFESIPILEMNSL